MSTICDILRVSLQSRIRQVVQDFDHDTFTLNVCSALEKCLHSLNVSGGRVRKNSVANAAAGSGNAASRPRANTLGHLDLSTLGFINNPTTEHPRTNQFNIGNHRMSMSNAQRPSEMDLHAMQDITPSGMGGQHDGFDGLINPRIQPNHSLRFLTSEGSAS